MNINIIYITSILLLCISIYGIVLLINPLFNNKNIELSNIKLIIIKITLIVLWISLITTMNIIKTLIIVLNNSMIKLIFILGIVIYYLFMIYGLYNLTISVFEKDGIYITNNTNLTINSMKLSLIYAFISIPLFLLYDIYYDFIK